MNRKILRAKEIADMYGISVGTVWLYVKQGKLKAIKISHRVTVFDVKDVEVLFGIRKQDPLIKDIKKRKKLQKEKIQSFMERNLKKESDIGYEKSLQQMYQEKGAFNLRIRPKKSKRNKTVESFNNIDQGEHQKSNFSKIQFRANRLRTSRKRQPKIERVEREGLVGSYQKTIRTRGRKFR